MAKTVKIYEVLYDTGRDGGPAGDGTEIARFREKEGDRARAFAALSTCYGRPCKVPEPIEVPFKLARRWGVA